ncbi:MAG: spermine synthase [Anaerolineales bacterium]|nr:spermine synthase [Anaerolineales bacterium]
MRRKIVMLAVFTAGMTTLGVELTASRLLGSVYGTSNIVWANIIGLILVYLTAGYFIGGRLADSYPFHKNFYLLLAWAALGAGLVPILARPVLLLAAAAVEELNAAVMVGSFLSVLVLFGVPVTLLGCVSPYAIRLLIRDPSEAGRISGRVYAVSTLGSILGTFLPVLVLIPTIGTSRSFLFFSLTLIAVAFVGLYQQSRASVLRLLWMPIVILILSWFVLSGPFKNTEGQIFEKESSYNYIQVVERDGTRYLFLNEGQGIHSMYNPETDVTLGTWDYFLSAPFFNAAPYDPSNIERVGIVGLAGGTIAKQYSKTFGPIPIDGWEIDPEIIEVGRNFFDMNEPNLNAIPQDGRWGLSRSQHEYSVIGIDAYRLPYIPWHLTTQEFFLEVKDHLSEDGVVIINVGRTPEDRRLIEAMAGTLQSVFPSVHLVDVPNTFNSILYATVKPTTIDNMIENYAHLFETGASPFLLDVIERTVLNTKPIPETDIVFTDEQAPIEQLTDAITIRFILQGSLDIMR